MKKSMKKTFLAMIIIATLFSCTTSVYASTSNIDEAVSIQFQAKTLIEEVDVKSLLNDAIKLKMGSTVKKIGEVFNKNGEKANMYVAVVTATEDPKMDYNQKTKYGVEATAYVYWIDNYGTENQLYAVKGYWETNDVEVTNRRITYGACNLLGWTDTPTTEFADSNSKKIYNSSYTGFMLKCETRIDVVNLGTVTCIATSSALTR